MIKKDYCNSSVWAQCKCENRNEESILTGSSGEETRYGKWMNNGNG